MKKNGPHWSEDPAGIIKRHNRVRNNRSAPLSEARTFLQMYHNRPATLMQGSTSVQIIDTKGLRDLGFNVLAEAVRGATSQVCKPLTAVVTPIDGDWRQKQTCQSFGQLLNGAMEACDFLATSRAMRVESALVPESFAIWEPDPVTKDFRCMRLDPMETFFSQDRTEVTTKRAMSRRWVKAAYGMKDRELGEAIDCMKPYHPDHLVGVDAPDAFEEDDTIAWYEGFVLPVGNLPGRHVVALSKDVVIVDEAWDAPLMPIVSAVWQEGHRGRTDGKPLARIVAPFMAWENEMHLKMQDALAGCVPWVVGPPGTKPPSDAPFQIVETPEGAPPNSVSVTVPRAVSQDVREHGKDLHEAAMRASGVSEQAASGTAPPQFKSGIALARWRDIVNTSLSEQHYDHQGLWTQSGRILAVLGKKHFKGKSVNVKRAIGSDVLSKIRWDDIDLPEKSYSLNFEAVSALGDTIGQRLENLEIVKDLGMIDIPQMALHLDVPDLRAVAKRMNGPRAYLEYQISRALNDGVVEPPISGMQDPKVCAKSCGEAYLAVLAEEPRPPKLNLEAMRILWRLFLNLMGSAPMGVAPGAPESTPAAPGSGVASGAGNMMPSDQALASPGPLPETPVV